METAIKRAIEGGYKIKATQQMAMDFYENMKFVTGQIVYSQFLLDPRFWQCLGKAEGWDEEDDGDCYGWQYYWHSFIDYLISDKSVDSFFQELFK